MTDYRKNAADEPYALALTMPEHVSEAVPEVAANMREGLLALKFGADCR